MITGLDALGKDVMGVHRISDSSTIIGIMCRSAKFMRNVWMLDCNSFNEHLLKHTHKLSSSHHPGVLSLARQALPDGPSLTSVVIVLLTRVTNVTSH